MIVPDARPLITRLLKACRAAYKPIRLGGDEVEAGVKARLRISEDLTARTDMSIHLGVAQDHVVVRLGEERTNENDVAVPLQCRGRDHGLPGMPVSVSRDINDAGLALRLLLHKVMKIGNIKRRRVRNVATEVGVGRGGRGEKRKKRKRR